ncbi:MAG: 7-carboxy-7-deazaguanine synthase QueE [Elusimicrobia bacterium]|nr:7-carboxy-7-deazaguanine synthase QueE [Elusimicrobiota bacterium]
MNENGLKLSKTGISEIFFSFQGEGLFFAEPQIFVRFSGCNIKCCYCDTKTKNKNFHGTSAVVYKVRSLIRKNEDKFIKNRSKTVVLTGGEPLLWKDFIASLLPRLKRLNYLIYLETNGILSNNLKSVIKRIDVVSMDIKLPSDCKNSYWKDHRKFLEICKDKAFAKLVISDRTKNEEVLRAVNMVSDISKKIPFVFQTVSPIKNINKPAIINTEKWIEYAKKKLDKVYLIPQLHKVWYIN